MGDEVVDGWIGLQMPSFAFTDQVGQNWDTANLSGEVYVAYFSTPWCSHCKTTLDAFDQAIPEDSLLVFNKDAEYDSSDMVEWHNTTEEEFERQINRPFIHAPELADAVVVEGIPFALFVDGDGTVIDYTLGKRENPSLITELWEDAIQQ